MSKELFISSTPHETKVAITEEDQLTEIYFERENEYTLAGSIYKGKVTRVLPGMQSAFVDIGLERDAFLYVTDFLEQQEEDDLDLSKDPAQSRREGGREQRQDRQESRQESRHEERRREPRGEQVSAQPNGATEAEGGEEGEQQAGTASSGEREGSRRWRGRRRRGRRGGQGGERGEQQQSQQPGAGEGFEARQSAGGEDESLEPMPGESLGPVSGAQGEPSSRGPEQAGSDVLPGESISRHRNPREERPARGSRRSFEQRSEPESREAEPRREAAPQPTHFERPSQINAPGPVTWAGDAMLPGESIAKYRGEGGAPPSEETRSEASSSERGDRDRGRGRFDRDRGRGGRDRGRGRFDRDRGRGGRDRGDRDRGPRESYSAPEAPISGPEIFALPGESISKYRGAAPEATQHTREAAASDVAPAESLRANAPEMMASIHQHEPAHGPQSRGAVLDDASSDAQHFEERNYSREKESAPSGRFAGPSSAFERSELAQLAPSHESSQSMEPAASDDRHFEEEEVEEQEDLSPKSANAQQPEARGEEDSRIFAPGAGVVEEEEIEEEESDAPFHERLDLDAYEDLEEETLDAESSEQLVDAVRDAHVRRRLESVEPNGHNVEEAEQRFEVADGVAEAEAEIVEETDEDDEADAEPSGFESEEMGEVEEALDDEGEEENADRAELRAPAGTAAFQQRTASPDRERSRDRFRRGGRRGRPMVGSSRVDLQACKLEYSIVSPK